MLRKLTSMLLACTMALSMFASTAFAAQLPESVQPLLGQLEEVFAELEAGELADITAAQTKLKGLQAADKLAITKPAWQQIEAKASGATAVNEQSVSDLFLAILSIQYGDAEAELLNVYTNHLGTIEELVELGGSSLDEVSFDDLADLVTKLEARLQVELRKMSFLDLIANGVNESFNKIFVRAYAGVISSGNPLAVALDNLGVDETTMIAMKDALADRVDENRRAAYALAIGYIRTDASLDASRGNSPFAPTLEVLGRTIPSDQLDWSIVSQVSGSTVSVSEDGVFTVPSDTGTAKVAVAISMMGRSLKLYEGNITVDGESTPTNPPVNPPVVQPETPVEDEPGVGDVIGELDDVIGGLDEIATEIDPNAEPTQVAEAVKDAAAEIAKVASEAKAKAEQALKQAATVTAMVASEGGVAKAQIETAAVVEQIARIQEQAKQLREKLATLRESANAKLNELKNVAGEALDEPIDELDDADLEIAFVIDLGAVAEDQAEAAISSEIVAALKEAGITRLTIAVNGVGVTVPAKEFGSDVTVTIAKAGRATAAGDVSIAAVAPASYIQTRVAADQYEMKIKAHGQEVTRFAEPVTVSIPLASAKGYYTEYLTVVSIDANGDYVYYTGKYNGETGTVDAQVYSLSGPYTVVETSVDFTDLAVVQSWAGTEIYVAAAKGIINGKGDGLYDPTGVVTRAEFAKMIVLAFNLHDTSATESFSDVNTGDWFQSYVASAAKAGLMNGKGNGIFDPLAPITRAEMATIAARALQTVEGIRGVSDADAVLSRFADADDVIASLRSGTALAARLGIVIGSDGKFDPQGVSTRAAAAVVIYRLINID